MYKYSFAITIKNQTTAVTILSKTNSNLDLDPMQIKMLIT